MDKYILRFHGSRLYFVNRPTLNTVTVTDRKDLAKQFTGLQAGTQKTTIEQQTTQGVIIEVYTPDLIELGSNKLPQPGPKGITLEGILDTFDKDQIKEVLVNLIEGNDPSRHADWDSIKKGLETLGIGSYLYSYYYKRFKEKIKL